MNQDMNKIYGQDMCNDGAGTLRNCGEGFGKRKAVAALRKDFSRFLRFAAFLLLMVAGVNTAWGCNSGSNYGNFAINITKF